MIVLLFNPSSELVFLAGFTYLLIALYTIARILLDTRTTSKTLAYLMLVIVVPFFGILFYYSFGVNTRRIRSSGRIAKIYADVATEFATQRQDDTDDLLAKHRDSFAQYTELVRFLKNLGDENLTANHYRLLINGEEKFPQALRIMEEAEEHIHMEYYDWENDIRGNQIKDVLLQKAREGVSVRVIYDAYASRKIRRNIVRELRAGGVQIFPILRVKLVGLANRINHRDHRKLIIVDGKTGFVGGINVSDRYDNSIDTGLYWRDTHVMISGPGVMNLQRHFVVNWNACQPKSLHLAEVTPQSFTPHPDAGTEGCSQILAGGPIYPMSNVMLSYSRMFTLARHSLYITNPYFIPNETILDTLKQVSKSGVDVRILLPEKSDSVIVGAASKFYFKELLHAGVRIFLYKKGFIHAKTAVADGRVSIVGTANMDIRSFDLNFEIFSVIYGKAFAQETEAAFLADLQESREIDFHQWTHQGQFRMFLYATARLISSFL